jgi:stage II sporulation protein D
MALALVAALTAGAAPTSGAATNWTASGFGFGHGVGMSQWGAYGYAKHGASHKDILLHYYTGASLGQTTAGKIRVLLLAGAPSVKFFGAKSACGKTLNPAKGYKAARSGSAVLLRRKRKTLANCGSLLSARGGGHLSLPAKGRTYRGGLEVRPAAIGGLNAINRVGLEQYVRGVVPNESPSSWPGAALRAQAIAARSYVLATRTGGISDVYDDTRSQVYGGRGTETAPTNDAVAATAGTVVKYGGAVAATFFFSSSGGQTENVEFGMPGASPQPYLKAVDDPYDGSAPLHSWTRSISDAKMQAALGGLVPGSLQSIEVTQTGISPRIVKAKLHGSSGDATVSGATIRSRLGLPSSWVRFTPPS